MGRRKIEIKAIKDDRNRSVTFLKRKGGLFKKAHELSVLCSVDVAVIIFGNNKKLYEYSSSDIGEILTRYQYCGAANEHKGPADFNEKGKLDDDYDDDDGSGPSHHGSVEPQMMPPKFQNQAAYQLIRHHTPSASPPIPPSSVFSQHHHQPQRKHTPQPQLPDTRPTSRNASTRTGSNIIPQHSHPSNGYSTYMTNIAMYNSHTAAIPQHPHAILPHLQGPPMQGLPMQSSQYTPPPPPPSHRQLHPHQQLLHKAYQEEQRKVTMPPAFPKERPSSRPKSSPPQPQQLPEPPPPPQEQANIKQEPQPAQQILGPVKRMSVKSRSIFTPIDESRSILSQHWASSTVKADLARNEMACSAGPSQSLMNGVDHSEKYPTPPVCAQSHSQNRSSDAALPEGLSRSSRTYSSSQSGGGGKRPVLKVQIPDEPSDEGSVTAISSSSPSATNAPSYSRRNRNTSDSLSSGVVLPPPSPSAGSLLSAGATGPPNPFARPHSVSQNSQSNTSNSNNNSSNNNNTSNSNKSNGNIVNGNISNSNINNNTNTNNHNSNNNNSHMIETPVSALPSRFMTNDFLPSPSSFLEWNFRGGDSNALPSPLNFATPVVGTGPSFIREDTSGSKEAIGNIYGKRKSPEEVEDAAQAKRLKAD